MSTNTQESTESKVCVKEPKKYQVIMHNDNKTTFDFVIQLLMSVFRKNLEEAREITVKVDRSGSAIVGIYAKEVAEQKVEDSKQIARQNNFPLFQVSYEEM